MSGGKPRPLDGIRVLDLSRLYPGPFCSMLLADFGADVVCIEDRRFAGEPSMPSTMRGKRHVALDLKRPEGRDLFFALAKNADVVQKLQPRGQPTEGITVAAVEWENSGARIPMARTPKLDRMWGCRIGAVSSSPRYRRIQEMPSPRTR